jgi:predicted ATPase
LFWARDQLAIEGMTGRLAKAGDEEILSPLTLWVRWNGTSSWSRRLPLSQEGSVSMTQLQMLSLRDPNDTDRVRVEMLNTGALDDDQAVKLLDKFILTPEESTLIEALRSIEPTIERIASASSEQGGRSSIFVKCAGIDERIPIGSMGDGIWRLLGIALSLVATRSGVLLIDEIDTGLHYSVMETMWKLVRETAERLDIQVFATTHSRDCYEALAAISREDAGENSEVTIQRIEKGKPRAVAFTERKIVIAARRGIEVR